MSFTSNVGGGGGNNKPTNHNQLPKKKNLLENYLNCSTGRDSRNKLETGKRPCTVWEENRENLLLCSGKINGCWNFFLKLGIKMQRRRGKPDFTLSRGC